MENHFSMIFHQLGIVASSINQPKAARVCLFDFKIRQILIYSSSLVVWYCFGQSFPGQTKITLLWELLLKQAGNEDSPCLFIIPWHHMCWRYTAITTNNPVDVREPSLVMAEIWPLQGEIPGKERQSSFYCLDHFSWHTFCSWLR